MKIRKMNSRQLFLSITLACFILALSSCIKPKSSTSTFDNTSPLVSIDKSNADSKPNKILNLSEYRAADIMKEIISHKNLQDIGLSDTLVIDSNLKSVLTSKYSESVERGTFTFCRLEIFDKNIRVFKKDSTLAPGMYCYNKQAHMLTIPILNDQYDDFSTSTSLYLCDLSSGQARLIDGNLHNCQYALISNNGDFLIYNNGPDLIKYQVSSQESKTILSFDKENICIFKLIQEKDKVKMYYYEDICKDIIENKSMRMSSFKI